MKKLPIHKGFFLALLLVVGCDQAALSDESAVTTESYDSLVRFPALIKKSENPNCVADAGNPFSCLAQACEHSGGQYDRSQKECQCPTGLVFYGSGKGACIVGELQVGPSSPGFLNLWNQDPREFRAQVSPVWHLGPKTFLHFESLFGFSRPQVDRELATWLDREVEKGPLGPRLWALEGSDSVQWYIGEGAVPRTVAVDMLTALDARLSLGASDQVFRTTPFYEKEASLIPAALGMEINPALFAVGEPNFTDERRQAVATALNEAYLNARQMAFEPDSVANYRQEGCSGYCDATQTLPVSQSQFTAQVVKTYGAGVPVRRLIQILQKDEEAKGPLGVAVLNPGGGISHFFLLTRSESSTSLQVMVSTYRRDWTSLSLDIPLHFDGLAQEKLFSETGARPQAPVAGTKALICEGALRPSRFAKLGLWPKLLLGPNASLLGWTKGNGPYPSLTGVASFTSQGLPWNQEALEEHTTWVHQIFIKSAGEGAHVAALEMGSCFDQYAQWKPEILKTGIRTINVSAGFLNDAKSCKNSSAEKALTDPEAPFLWILAAGNASVNADESDTFSCPQNIAAGVSNRIVVAGIKNDAIADYSNFGVQYADIAADGTLNGVAGGGTSFAAPRVSAVAAELSALYPKIPPQDIRKILLTSARIPFANGRYEYLPLRSGGILDTEMAKKFARWVNEAYQSGRYPDYREILNYEFCWSRRVGLTKSCAFAQAKIHWLTLSETAVIP